MNKIEKFLKKLSPSNRKEIQEIILSIIHGSVKNMDVRKIKGFTSLYRIRKGRIRIIFSQYNTGTHIEKIDFRSDNTY